MKVYFNKLDNGDWVCHDQSNPTDNLWVDPSKIELLLTQLGPITNVDPENKRYQYIFGQMPVHVAGFGKMSVDYKLWFDDNKIQRLDLVNEEGNSIARFDKNFTLELQTLPAFDPYPAQDDDELVTYAFWSDGKEGWAIAIEADPVPWYLHLNEYDGITNIVLAMMGYKEGDKKVCYPAVLMSDPGFGKTSLIRVAIDIDIVNNTLGNVDAYLKTGTLLCRDITRFAVRLPDLSGYIKSTLTV